MSLRSCPFCGSEDVEFHTAPHYEKGVKTNYREAAVLCHGCGLGVSPGIFGGGITDEKLQEHTTTIWNTRV